MPMTFWQYEGKPSSAGTRMVNLWWSSLSIVLSWSPGHVCTRQSDRFYGPEKREGTSRAPSPGTAPKTSPQRRVYPAWPLELSRCSPKSICDPSCCRSGPWWTVSIIKDPGLAHDIPLQRVQQALFDFCALLIYFLSSELRYAEYTNTTSLDLMDHSFQRSWRHTDLLSSSYSGEGVFEMIPLTVLLMGHLLFPSQGCQLEISELLIRGWSQICLSVSPSPPSYSYISDFVAKAIPNCVSGCV